MSKHKALELADACDAEQRRTVQLDVMHSSIAAELRALHAREQRQHALIVQMREELRATLSLIRRNAPELSGKQLGLADDALAAADQYLGEQA